MIFYAHCEYSRADHRRKLRANDSGDCGKVPILSGGNHWGDGLSAANHGADHWNRPQSGAFSGSEQCITMEGNRFEGNVIRNWYTYGEIAADADGNILTEQDLNRPVPYVRVLGFNDQGRQVLKQA